MQINSSKAILSFMVNNQVVLRLHNEYVWKEAFVVGQWTCSFKFILSFEREATNHRTLLHLILLNYRNTAIYIP